MKKLRANRAIMPKIYRLDWVEINFGLRLIGFQSYDVS